MSRPRSPRTDSRLSSGDTKTVGVGGLTLGGGVGWFVRLWGLAIDSLVSAEVVLADGRIVTASETQEPDLFWALRGGGGNFGAVTSFTFRARPLPNGVVTGAIDLAPDADLAAAFTGWRDAMRAAPEELTTSYLGFPSFGDEIPPVSQIVFVWAGDDLDAAAAAIEPLLAIPGVTAHTIEHKPYADVLMDEQPDADQVDAPAMRMIDDNGFAAQFDDKLIADLADVKRELGDTILMVRILGGAYGRVAPDATAWGFRDTEAWLISVAFVPEAMYDEAAPRRAGGVVTPQPAARRDVRQLLDPRQPGRDDVPAGDPRAAAVDQGRLRPHQPVPPRPQHHARITALVEAAGCRWVSAQRGR